MITSQMTTVIRKYGLNMTSGIVINYRYVCMIIDLIYACILNV